MLATPPADWARAHEKTVRLRLRGLPVKPLVSPAIDNAAQTVRARALEQQPTKPLPKAISAFDGKTMRMRPIDPAVVGPPPPLLKSTPVKRAIAAVRKFMTRA